LYAPMNLRKKLIKYIDFEINEAKEGRYAQIGIKVNNITDKEIIDKLYEASQAGVKCSLIVRGACSIVTNKEFSRNITVVSCVGRLLEHSRMYMFNNGGHPKVFIGSSDLMERSFDRRFEVACPIKSKHIVDRLIDIFNIYF